MPYWYKRRTSTLIRGPWMPVSGSSIDYEINASTENSCSNEKFGSFLRQLCQVIVLGEPNQYQYFAMRIETFINESQEPYRYFNTFFMYKNQHFGLWQELYPKYDSVSFRQSDAEGDEELHSDAGLNCFFMDLRSRFRDNRFPILNGRHEDDLALFLG